MDNNKTNEIKYTPEWVMQMFAETDKQIKELAEDRKETDKQIKETDKRLEKMFAETDKRIKAVNKQIGCVSDSIGEATEETIYNVLETDMTFANIKFDYMKQKVPVMEGLNTLTELDILMVNGSTISIIEAKHKVEKKDVTELIKNKLPYFRQCFPDYKKHKIVLGIGGMSFQKSALEEAKKNGVGIIKAIGEKVEFYTEGIKMF